MEDWEDGVLGGLNFHRNLFYRGDRPACWAMPGYFSVAI